jgi:hypothetical protein
METRELNYRKRDNYVSYRMYKNEYHPLFLAFVRGDDKSITQCCNLKYNVFREVKSETKNVLTIATWESNISLFQDAMFKNAAWLANEIWTEKK